MFWCNQSNWKYHKNCISVLCLILLSLGAVLIALKGNVYSYGIRTLLNFESGSSLFKSWSVSPPGVNFDVYVFNWTNPEDFRNQSTKPILKEIGPFRFKQKIEKVNATFHNNDTVSFYRRRTFHFCKEESVHDLDFNLTIPNPVAMSIAHKARDWSFFTQKAISIGFHSLINNEPHVTKPAGEIMFSGYKDPVLNFIKSLPFVTDVPAMDKFGFFYKKNASATFDGIFNVGTGGSHPLGQIYEWNYNTNTTYYHKNCNSFKGSAGDFFPKYKNPDILEVFHSDLCRTILLDYEKNTTLYGMEGLKYVLGDHSLDNGTKIPGNKCTCGEHCLPYGVIYATACKGDTPNYLSLPHFYKADPSYADKLIGLKPDKEKHDFYIIYEPTTGIPLELFPRLQVNILMRPVSYIGMYDDIPSTLFPVLWFEQNLAIPSTSAILVKMLLIMKDICLSVGIVLITLSIVIFLFLMYRIRKSDFCPQEHHKNYLPKELVPLKEKDSHNC